MHPADLAALTAEQSRPIPADEMAARVQASGQLRTRDAQAAIICRARGNLATTQPAYGGPGLVGGLAAGLQLGWAGANAEQTCLATYQATGIMPTY
jgi:hypothetical protein